MTDVLDESGKLAEREFGLVTTVLDHHCKRPVMWECGRKVTSTSLGRMSLDDPLRLRQSDGMSVSVACRAKGASEGSRPSALETAATLEPRSREECDFEECR